MAGRFITIEGGEGAGKSTQARRLARALEEHGLSVLVTREPGGTPGAEAIRALLLDPPGAGWSARAEALLFAAARSDHVEQAIRPALERGEWVLCDRYVDSSRAYQGGAGALGDEDVLALHRIGSDGLLPDLTVLITVSERQANARLANRDGVDADAIGGRGAAYHAQVGAAFASLAKAEPARFVVIDGDDNEDVVHAQIMAAVRPLRARSALP